MRLLIVADGNPLAHATNSGVARGITMAMRARPDTEVIGTASTEVPRMRRLLLAVLTFRPTRRWWWSTFNLGRLNIWLRSRYRDRASKAAGELDYVLQVRNIYLPASVPYVVFIDSTSAMANRGWLAWRPSKPLQRVRFKIEKAQFQGAKFIFTAGPQAARSVVEEYGIDGSKVRAVGGGINFERLPDSAELSVHRRARSPEILFVGIDFERKGGDLLVAAYLDLVARYPDLTLTLVGGRPLNVPDHPNIRIVGKVFDRERMAALYRDASIFCLPARHEPYGLVVQEAMAFNLPCVVSDVGALPSVVKHGETGFVVPSESGRALVGALETLLVTPSLRSGFGKKGRARAETDLTWAAVAERMVSTLNALNPDERPDSTPN
jgi:glycosyltransferase involved in cell wall biosynthesis